MVLDNLKEGVLKPDLYEPELNPVYAAALAHYGVVADPARVRDPNRKGTVENAIGHTQATALKGRRFESIEEQNTFLEHWEAKWAASRIHGSERRQVQAMFEEERPHLQPLPLLGMQYFTEAQRTVCDDSCVRVDHSSYAARPAPIGSRVLVRVFEQPHRDPRPEDPGPAAHPRPRRTPRHGGAARRRARVQPVARDAPHPGPGQGHRRRRGSRLCELLFAIEGRVGPAQAVGHRQPGRALPAPPGQQRLRAGPGRRHLQLPARQGRYRAAGGRGAGGHRAAPDAAPVQGELALTQEHRLIRSADDYAELFARGAAQPPRTTSTPNTTTTEINP